MIFNQSLIIIRTQENSNRNIPSSWPTKFRTLFQPSTLEGIPLSRLPGIWYITRFLSKSHLLSRVVSRSIPWKKPRQPPLPCTHFPSQSHFNKVASSWDPGRPILLAGLRVCVLNAKSLHGTGFVPLCEQWAKIILMTWGKTAGWGQPSLISAKTPPTSAWKTEIILICVSFYLWEPPKNVKQLICEFEYDLW